MPMVVGSIPTVPTTFENSFAGVSFKGRTLVFGTNDGGSNPSAPASFGLLAQLAEQRTFNPSVPGSIPGRPTTL